MLWKRRNTISTETMAHEQHEVQDAYARGRRDERKARKRHPIMMTLTFAAALVGGVVLVLAAKEGSFARSGGIVDHGLAVACERKAHLQVATHAPFDEPFETDFPAFEVGRPPDALHVGLGNALHPHRLPDSARARVPDTVRMKLPILLAARLGEVVRVVFGPQRNDLSPAGAQRVGDVEREGGVPSLVLTDVFAVDPHTGQIVDRAEMEQDAPHVGVGEKLTLVPAVRMETGIADATQARFRSERHLNRVCPGGDVARMRPVTFIVEGESPGSIEILPLVATQLRTRVTGVEVVLHWCFLAILPQGGAPKFIWLLRS